MLSCSLAHAHSERYPKRDRLELRADGATLIVDYAVPRGEDARALREIFDRDRSQLLDSNELAALGRYLADQATHFIALTLDDQPLALERDAPQTDLEPLPDGRLAVRVVLRARYEPGKHDLLFKDRHKDRRIAVPLELALEGVHKDSSLPPQPLLDAAHPIRIIFSPP